MAVLGEVLKTALVRNGMSQSQLAICIHKTPGYVSHLITGRQNKIDPDISEKIANALQTSPTFWSDISYAERSGTARSTSEYLAELDVQQSGSGPTHDLASGVLVDFQIEALVEASQSPEIEADADAYPFALVIHEFEPSRVNASSYDTIIGGTWKRELDRLSPIPLQGETLEIPAHSAVQVFTHETIRMPRHMHARVAPASSFVNLGLIVGHGPIIDPLYEGVLTVTLHNPTNRPILLDTNSPFLTIIFERLQTVPQRAEPIRGPNTERSEARKELSELKARMIELEAQIEREKS